MGASLFVSYRRDDSSSAAGRLVDHLIDHGLGGDNGAAIFMDIDDIPPGADYRQVIQETLEQSEIVLVVIGRRWLTVTDDEGNRRLDSISDTHRLEVAAALRSDARVVPVLVEGGSAPHADHLPDDIADLAFRNAFEVSNSRFRDDAENLAGWLERLAAEVRDDRAAARRAEAARIASERASESEREREAAERAAAQRRAEEREEAEAQARLRKEQSEASYYETLERQASRPSLFRPASWPAGPRRWAIWLGLGIAALSFLPIVVAPIMYVVNGPDENLATAGDVVGVVVAYSLILGAGCLIVYLALFRRRSDRRADRIGNQ